MTFPTPSEHLAEPIRVLVADDHPMFAEAASLNLGRSPRIDVVATEGNGRDAFEKIEELRPDVALLDIAMPGLDGPAILALLTQSSSPTRVIFLSGSTEGQLVHGALAAGAHGYLAKTCTSAELIDAVEQVHAGGTALSAEASAALVGRLHVTGRQALPELTGRERQVMELIAEGCSFAEIGARIHVSGATVKTHASTLYSKLGVSERAAMVAEAMRRGLLR